MDVSTCGGPRNQMGIILDHSFALFYEADSQLNPECTDMASLSRQRILRIPGLSLLRLELYKAFQAHQAFIYEESRDLKSGSHACLVNALTLSHLPVTEMIFKA